MPNHNCLICNKPIKFDYAIRPGTSFFGMCCDFQYKVWFKGSKIFEQMLFIDTFMILTNNLKELTWVSVHNGAMKESIPYVRLASLQDALNAEANYKKYLNF
jgi:hypothetical protein